MQIVKYTLTSLFVWPQPEPADYLPPEPPYVDDPEWLIGRTVKVAGRLYRVAEWKYSLGDTWVYLIPEQGWQTRWVLVDDCLAELGLE